MVDLFAEFLISEAVVWLATTWPGRILVAVPVVCAVAALFFGWSWLPAIGAACVALIAGMIAAAAEERR